MVETMAEFQRLLAISDEYILMSPVQNSDSEKPKYPQQRYGSSKQQSKKDDVEDKGIDELNLYNFTFQIFTHFDAGLLLLRHMLADLLADNAVEDIEDRG